MDDMNDIFNQATDADLDTELAAAGELLQKIAQQEGIDLSQLSDEDVAELMVDLLPKTAADEGEHESAREESSEDRKKEKKKEEAKMASEITFADVAVELNKVAANEGIDLNGLSREQYHELFDIVAESMQDPNYMENKLAEDEASAKLAEADALGRYMARAFMDEQEKIAFSPKGIYDLARHGGSTRTEAARQALSHAAKGVRAAVEPALEKERGISKRVGEALTKRLDAARKHVEGNAARMGSAGDSWSSRLDKAHTSLGRKALAAGGATAVAGTGAAAYGAKKMMDRGEKKKRSLDDAALEMARDYLLENGINPDTGDKLAADADADAVAERAAEILAEAGWF